MQRCPIARQDGRARTYADNDQRIRNPQVAGSIPAGGSFKAPRKRGFLRWGVGAARLAAAPSAHLVHRCWRVGSGRTAAPGPLPRVACERDRRRPHYIMGEIDARPRMRPLDRPGHRNLTNWVHRGDIPKIAASLRTTASGNLAPPHRHSRRMLDALLSVSVRLVRDFMLRDELSGGGRSDSAHGVKNSGLLVVEWPFRPPIPERLPAHSSGASPLRAEKVEP